MNQNLNTNVLISGGGPSGMIAALYLSKLGINNILLDRKPSIQSHPKAHEVSSRSLEILHTLGVNIEKLIKEASDYETASKILFCNTINDEIGRIDLSDPSIQNKYISNVSVHVPYLNISQTELEKILRQTLAKEKNTIILLNHQLNSFEEVDEFVNARIENRESNQQFLIQSKYLIAADGANSRIRKQLGIKLKGPNKIQDVVNAYFTNDLSQFIKTKAKLYWIFNPKSAGVMIAHHPEKRWVYHLPIETPYEKIEDYNEAYFQKKLQIATGLGEDYQFNIQSISHWRMTAQIAEKFRKGNIFLIGDAAHRFPPTGGLGMNSGIADAFNLCWKIKSVLCEESADSILDSYETERMPIVVANCKESKFNWEKILEVPASLGLNVKIGTLCTRILYSIPNIILPFHLKNYLRSRIEIFAEKQMNSKRQNTKATLITKHKINEQIQHFDRIGLDLGYSYVQNLETNKGKQRLNIDSYEPEICIGKRFPHFFLDPKIKKHSSHSLLSPTQFTLIIFEESPYKKIVLELEKEMGKKSILSVKMIKANELEIDTLQKLKVNISSLILVRPDGHVFGLSDEFEEPSSVKFVLKNWMFQIAKGVNIMNQIPSMKNKVNKDNKMFIGIGILFLTITLFVFYLFRPLAMTPTPAQFDLVELSEGTIHTFSPKPNLIYGMGLVYANHIAETANNFDPNISPPIFLKHKRTLVSSEKEILLPNKDQLLSDLFAFEPELKNDHRLSNVEIPALLDYEVELGFVLLEDINPDSLFDLNFSPKIGFFIANDLSARTLAVFGEGKNNRAEYWGVSKSFEGFLPISSSYWIPKSFKPNLLPNIELETYVNGELRQKEKVSNMIYTPKEMLQWIHKKYPSNALKKGDMIITGTPGGVAMTAPRFLSRLLELLNVDRFTKLKLVLKKDNSKFLKGGDEVLVKGLGLAEIKSKIIEK